ncbi:MAG TPA: nucleotide pyrophosphohydrolase [bacterium (Candidatus Stahlbacteria)]|nr:nucleotide pyrophosphohydrolase [Candidatus Stahlbacteria bacterium]
MDLKEYQEIISRTYLSRDQNRGIYKTLIWLVEEVGELARAVRNGQGLEEEFADVLAWLLSVANLAGIDVDSAMDRYRDGCPKCKKQPCECPVDKWT